MKHIIVNATALDRSGALSILRQFVKNIPVDDRRWLIFVSPDVPIITSNPNVRIEPIEGVKAMHRRLWWDAIGLKHWLRKNDIDPEASVSLQNTSFNVGKNVPSYIYYHQPIPFFPFSWSIIKKEERTLWFYKNIYPFFVKLFLKKDTRIFVQLEFIKDGFVKRFGHHEGLIDIYSPSVLEPKVFDTDKNEVTKNIRLFYPAMPHFYKNHRVIEEALKLTDADVEILFTINHDSHRVDDKRLKNICMQSYDKISEFYNTCDALIFPSYIETFGLPLLEAAMTGMPIIAVDLPYAREVLDGYEGVSYVPYNNPQAWATAIEKAEKGKRYKPIDISNRPGWKELFRKIKV